MRGGQQNHRVPFKLILPSDSTNDILRTGLHILNDAVPLYTVYIVLHTVMLIEWALYDSR